MVSEPEPRRRTAHRRPITTLRPGDHVTIFLRGRATEQINTWGGKVVAVDAVAIRIQAAWYRFGIWPMPAAADEERIISWSRVETVQPEHPS